MSRWIIARQEKRGASPWDEVFSGTESECREAFIAKESALCGQQVLTLLSADGHEILRSERIASPKSPARDTPAMFRRSVMLQGSGSPSGFTARPVPFDEIVRMRPEAGPELELELQREIMTELARSAARPRGVSPDLAARCELPTLPECTCPTLPRKALDARGLTDWHKRGCPAGNG